MHGFSDGRDFRASNPLRYYVCNLNFIRRMTFGRFFGQILFMELTKTVTSDMRYLEPLDPIQ